MNNVGFYEYTRNPYQINQSNCFSVQNFPQILPEKSQQSYTVEPSSPRNGDITTHQPYQNHTPPHSRRSLSKSEDRVTATPVHQESVSLFKLPQESKSESENACPSNNRMAGFRVSEQVQNLKRIKHNPNGMNDLPLFANDLHVLEDYRRELGTLVLRIVHGLLLLLLSL